jgi:hypothetical protein
VRAELQCHRCAAVTESVAELADVESQEGDRMDAMPSAEQTRWQQFALARLKRLLALASTPPGVAADCSPDPVAWAVLSTFHDCVEAGVGLEASLVLHSWLGTAGVHGSTHSGGR